jgi:hypothetical protein
MCSQTALKRSSRGIILVLVLVLVLVLILILEFL